MEKVVRRRITAKRRMTLFGDFTRAEGAHVLHGWFWTTSNLSTQRMVKERKDPYWSDDSWILQINDNMSINIHQLLYISRLHATPLGMSALGLY